MWRHLVTLVLLCACVSCDLDRHFRCTWRVELMRQDTGFTLQYLFPDTNVAQEVTPEIEEFDVTPGNESVKLYAYGNQLRITLNCDRPSDALLFAAQGATPAISIYYPPQTTYDQAPTGPVVRNLYGILVDLDETGRIAECRVCMVEFVRPGWIVPLPFDSCHSIIGIMVRGHGSGGEFLPQAQSYDLLRLSISDRAMGGRGPLPPPRLLLAFFGRPRESPRFVPLHSCGYVLGPIDREGSFMFAYRDFSDKRDGRFICNRNFGIGKGVCSCSTYYNHPRLIVSLPQRLLIFSSFGLTEVRGEFTHVNSVWNRAFHWTEEGSTLITEDVCLSQLMVSSQIDLLHQWTVVGIGACADENKVYLGTVRHNTARNEEMSREALPKMSEEPMSFTQVENLDLNLLCGSDCEFVTGVVWAEGLRRVTFLARSRHFERYYLIDYTRMRNGTGFSEVTARFGLVVNEDPELGEAILVSLLGVKQCVVNATDDVNTATPPEVSTNTADPGSSTVEPSATSVPTTIPTMLSTPLPSTDVPTSLPSTDVPTSLPSTDVPTSLPSTDVPTSLPSTSLPSTSLPSTSLPSTSLPINVTTASTDVPSPTPPTSAASATAAPVPSGSCSEISTNVISLIPTTVEQGIEINVTTVIPTNLTTVISGTATEIPTSLTSLLPITLTSLVSSDLTTEVPTTITACDPPTTVAPPVPVSCSVVTTTLTSLVISSFTSFMDTSLVSLVPTNLETQVELNLTTLIPTSLSTLIDGTPTFVPTSLTTLIPITLTSLIPLNLTTMVATSVPVVEPTTVVAMETTTITSCDLPTSTPLPISPTPTSSAIDPTICPSPSPPPPPPPPPDLSVTLDLTGMSLAPYSSNDLFIWGRRILYSPDRGTTVYLLPWPPASLTHTDLEVRALAVSVTGMIAVLAHRNDAPAGENPTSLWLSYSAQPTEFYQVYETNDFHVLLSNQESRSNNYTWQTDTRITTLWWQQDVYQQDTLKLLGYSPSAAAAASGSRKKRSSSNETEQDAPGYQGIQNVEVSAHELLDMVRDSQLDHGDLAILGGNIFIPLIVDERSDKCPFVDMVFEMPEGNNTLKTQEYGYRPPHMYDGKAETPHYPETALLAYHSIVVYLDQLEDQSQQMAAHHDHEFRDSTEQWRAEMNQSQAFRDYRFQYGLTPGSIELDYSDYTKSYPHYENGEQPSFTQLPDNIYLGHRETFSFLVHFVLKDLYNYWDYLWVFPRSSYYDILFYYFYNEDFDVNGYDNSISVMVTDRNLVDVKKEMVSSEVGDKLTYKITLTDRGNTELSHPGEGLVPVGLQIVAHNSPYRCLTSFSQAGRGPLGLQRTNVIVGCAPRLGVRFDWEASAQAVVDAGGRHFDCPYQSEHPDIPCFYFKTEFLPRFRIHDPLTGTSRPYEGSYSLRVIGGSNQSADSIHRFYENEVHEYNNEHASGSSRIFGHSSGQYTDDGWPLFTDASQSLLWLCGSCSPCANVKPKFPRLPEYFFLIRFNMGSGEHASTNCNLTLDFVVRVQGVPVSFYNTSLPIFLLTIAVMLLYLLLFWCCHRNNSRVYNGVRGSVLGVTSRFRSRDKNAGDEYMDEHREGFSKQKMLAGARLPVVVPVGGAGSSTSSGPAGDALQGDSGVSDEALEALLREELQRSIARPRTPDIPVQEGGEQLMGTTDGVSDLTSPRSQRI